MGVPAYGHFAETDRKEPSRKSDAKINIFSDGPRTVAGWIEEHKTNTEKNLVLVLAFRSRIYFARG